MKSIVVPSPLRTLVTCLVAVSLTGQQVVFAAGGGAPASAMPAHVWTTLNDVHALLPIPKTAKQAIVVIQLAESRPLSSYFEKGGNAAEIQRLDDDMKNLALANSLVGIADDLPVFQTWWESHQTSILLSRAQLQSSNLEAFFTQTFIVFKAERTQAQKDPNQFVEWLSAQVTNPYVLSASFAAGMAFTATLRSFLGILRGSIISGPSAGVVGAYVEPVVRPLREFAGIKGNKHWGKSGVRLSQWLFKERSSAKGALDDLNKMSSQIKEARENAKSANELLNTLGHEVSPEQFAANMEKLHSIWSETNNVWTGTNPSSFRDGRDVFANAVALRPQVYSGQIMQSLQGAEQARQAIEHHINSIISWTGKDPRAVENSVVSLMRAVEIDENAAEANKVTAKEDLQKSKDALKELGASDYQVERIIESRLSELVYVRHTAYTLAANVIHEINYPEYNRKLPEEVRTIQRILRRGTCLDSFHHAYRGEVSKILNEMGFRMDLAEDTVTAAKADLELKAGKAEKAPRAKAVKTPSRAKTFIQKKVSRAIDALDRFNNMGENGVAIERLGTLEGDKAETPAERAAEVVRRVGKR